MSDDHLRDPRVRYLIIGLLAAVVLFLIYGLVKGNGDNDAADTPTAAPAATKPQIPVVLKAQVGCQSPGTGATDSGTKTTPPNPGLRARKAGRGGTISVTIPVSTEECRVVKIRVQLDATKKNFLPEAGRAVTKTVSVLTGPPVRKIKVTLPSGAGVPQVARAFAVTADGRSSSGATVSIR